MKAIIIIGSKGFLGKNLEKKIKEHNLFKKYKIISLSRKKLDLLDKNAIQKKFREIKKKYLVVNIYNCAVLYKSANWVIENPAEISYINNLINLNILKYSQIFFPKCIYICMLSYALYNKNNKEIYIQNDYLTNKNKNSYADSKFNLLKYCYDFYSQYNFKSICVVITNLYGNENSDKNNNHFVSSIINKIIIAKKNNQNSINFTGNFMQTRDFLHIDDATDALIKLSKIKSVKGVNIINLGYGKSYKMKYIIDKVVKFTNYHGNINIIKKGSLNNKSINIFKIKKLINWGPKISIDEGLQKSLLWSIKQKK